MIFSRPIECSPLDSLKRHITYTNAQMAAKGIELMWVLDGAVPAAKQEEKKERDAYAS